MRSEEIVLLLRVLPSLGNIYRNPAVLRIEKFRPAVVARDFARGLIGGKWESDFELCWNFLRARHRNKERMKVGTVTALGIARPEHVAVAPSAAGLVVTHIREDVVVDSSGFLQFACLDGDDLSSQIRGHPGGRNQLVRGQKFLALFFLQRRIDKPWAAQADG